MTERLRRTAALVGLLLWTAYPFMYLVSQAVKRDHRCKGRTFSGHFDDCFNDMLPVIELGAFMLTAMLAYPFARLAMSMFAPGPALRSHRWCLAGQQGGVACFPAFQIAAAIGVAWALLHLRTIPPAFASWLPIGYWIAWIGWFVLGSYAASPLAARYDRTG